MTSGPKRRITVFLNIPYDAKFERLYLAFIAGLTGLGLDPRCVLEIPPQARAWNRLDRIVRLLRCERLTGSAPIWRRACDAAGIVHQGFV
jgi:hypothetical protein